MGRPRRFLVRMSLFVGAVAAVVIILIGPLFNAFMANPAINGLILGVFLLGAAYNFRQVLMLNAEVDWIEAYRQDRPGLSQAHPPRLLAAMATMLGERRDRLRLSTLSMRSLLDSIVSRLDESRDTSRYTIGLLVFLGLLGTFWGLLQTVSSISGVIGGMNVTGGDFGTVFQNLKTGLASPLNGMGTAFSSSLFGLGGSLVLGFLDLQASQAQNRFYNDLEEWLSSVTRLSSGAIGGEGEQSVPAYVQALLEQTAESLQNLQRTLQRGEESRTQSNSAMVQVMDKLGTLSDHMRAAQALMMKLGESQLEMRPILARLAEGTGAPAPAIDESTRVHIRNIDVYMARLVDDLATGRDEMVKEIRSEIKMLARTIAALAEEGGNRTSG